MLSRQELDGRTKAMFDAMFGTDAQINSGTMGILVGALLVLIFNAINEDERALWAAAHLRGLSNIMAAMEVDVGPIADDALEVLGDDVKKVH